MAGRPDFRQYSVAEIERVVEQFLQQHWHPSQAWVDIERIIEGPLGILIDYTSLDSFQALGSLNRRVSDGRLVIVVAEELADHNPNRYRFTLAQEVSHWLLHGEILDRVRTQQEAIEFHDSLQPDDYKRLEGSANRCAGAILMPLSQFTASARASYSDWHARLSEVGPSIRDTSRSASSTTWPSYIELAPKRPGYGLGRGP